jgi:5-methylcytosine-specific restriction endonuclease McrA
MNDYELHLKDLRWKFKRKIILERDGRKCIKCGSSKILQVHHTYYYSQKTEPWKYPDDSLITLCKVCHQEYHKNNKVEYRDRPEVLKRKIKKRKLKRKIKKLKKKEPPRRIPLARIQKRNTTDKHRKKINGVWVIFETRKE